LSGSGKKLTAAKTTALTEMTMLSNKYNSKVQIEWSEMLSMFPWVPLRTRPCAKENVYTGERIDGIFTKTARLPQTKAMPYAQAEFMFECGTVTFHGKVSSKNYGLYKKIIDMKPGTRAEVAMAGTNLRARILGL
jgi:hypothetical protein